MRLLVEHRKHTADGLFHGFNIPFIDAAGARVDAQSQARSILNTAKALIEEGQAPGVAITYSANTLQAVAIERAYAAGKWHTGTNGANQAEVIATMEALLRKPAYEALKGKLRIAPISTIDYNDPPLKPAEFNDSLFNDLGRIRTQYLNRGWVVLGWQNQLTAGNTEHPYAVGGGVARGASNAISDDQSEMIQAALVQYSQDFAPQLAPASRASPSRHAVSAGSVSGAPAQSVQHRAARQADVHAASQTGRQSMGRDPHNLDRFVQAQEPVYETAMHELRSGSKQTHWMWFVFPQLAALGQSDTAQRYGLEGLQEAKAYWEHPVVGPRLRASVKAMLQAEGSADSILQGDAPKLRSCLTLFSEVAPFDRDLQAALTRFYGSEPDDFTLALLGIDPDSRTPCPSGKSA